MTRSGFLGSTAARISLLLLVILTAGAAVFVVRLKANDPYFVFLTHENGAEWIRFDRPFDTGLQPDGLNTTAFRTTFSVPASWQGATLTLRTLKQAQVFVDETLVYEGADPPEDWKRAKEIVLPPDLAPGTHTLRVVATHDYGPVLVLAHCDELQLRTGPAWEASNDAESWTPAVSADHTYPSEVGHSFPRSDRALISLLPRLLPIFLVVALWRALIVFEKSPHWLTRITPGPRGIRWLVLIAWIVLAAHNLTNVSKDRWSFGYEWRFGYDVHGQMEYIAIIAEEHRIPLSGEAWKTSEPPLYFLIAAIPYALIVPEGSASDVVHYLRFFAVLCGLIQVELSYRILRQAFPERPSLQSIGTVVAAFVPINLYLSQYMNNLGLASALSSLAILMTFHYGRAAYRGRPVLHAAAIGGVLGLAVLSKLTAIVLALPIAVVLGCAALRRESAAKQTVLAGVIPIAAMMLGLGLVAGWYYARNVLAIGTVFPVGHEKSIGIAWFQDPGYRTWAMFTRFGESLAYPIYSPLVGYWDALYATLWSDAFLSSAMYPHYPPWRYTAMIAGVLLGLVPMTAMTVGFARTVRHPIVALDDGRLFAVITLASYLAAMIYLYLTAPVVSSGKAAYLLGVISCFGILAAAGYDTLRRSKLLDVAFCAALACWAATAWAAYFMSNRGTGVERIL